MADNLKYKNVYESMVIIRDFINNSYSGVSGSPIEDPYKSATGKSRSIFAQIEDEVLSISRFPKITISPLDPIDRERIAGGKTEYRERYSYSFRIMYTCEKNAVWTNGGVKYKGSHQCRRYLEYLGDKFKAYSSSLNEFNEIVVGGTSNIIKSPDSLKYSGVMVLKVDTYGRT